MGSDAGLATPIDSLCIRRWRRGPLSPQLWVPRADGRLEDWPPTPPGEAVLFDRLRQVCEEGLKIAARYDPSTTGSWHPFFPAEYDAVLNTLLEIRDRPGRFLELGSGTGVIAIMADLLGFEACGIEIVPELVSEARELARRHGSSARFAAGSFIPTGYQWTTKDGDSRMGTVGNAAPAYPELHCELTDFDWIYAYPWPGEAEIIRDLVRRCGAPDATLILHRYTGGLVSFPPVENHS